MKYVIMSLVRLLLLLFVIAPFLFIILIYEFFYYVIWNADYKSFINLFNYSNNNYFLAKIIINPINAQKVIYYKTFKDYLLNKKRYTIYNGKDTKFE